jgi:diguanylate cyclase (GGDEF)-like protein
VSIGVATQASDESWHQVLKRADQALYSAKHSGRNQVQLS